MRKILVAVIAMLLLFSACGALAAADRWTCEFCNRTNHRGFCTECGRSKEEATNKEAAACWRGDHQWDEGKTTREPTCAKEGEFTYTCLKCEAKRPEPLARLTTHGTRQLKNKKDPACDTTGYTGDWCCSICNTVLEKGSTISAKGHGRTELKNKKDATCGTQGYSGDTVCTVCGKVTRKGSAIAATGNHKWNGETVVTAATCAKEGSARHTCSVCGKTETYSTPKDTGTHNWKAATYTSPKICALCGKTEGSKVPYPKAGDVIYFGTYPQTKNGNDRTAIEWQVLRYDSAKDQVLVISRYVLDCVRYNENRTIVTWDISDIRAWLNGTFYTKAFSTEERKAVVKTRIAAEKFSDARDAGNDTDDWVFLLSSSEASQYFRNDDARKCAPTDYAVSQGCTTEKENKVNGRATCWWWVRTSASKKTSKAVYVGKQGTVQTAAQQVNRNGGGVRPAVWLKVSLIGWN